MLFIDSLYINNSGGLLLLQYLINELNDRQIDYILLADLRCKNRIDNVKKVNYLEASLLKRYYYYKKLGSDITTVLCFGNIPPPIKMNANVYTYFHNINLLTLVEVKSFKRRALSWMKRNVFYFFKHNTDFWIVQTTNTANQLKKHLHETNERIKILPFYNLPAKLTNLKNTKHGDDYVYIANYTPSKGHEALIEAWEILHKRGIDKTLHLTIDDSHSLLLQKMLTAIQQGAKIKNHGFIPFNSVIDLYRLSKAIIYPSYNESLGLGIIEALSAGCDLIGSDLPFIHAVCKPSEVFCPYQAESIADAVMRYENNCSQKSELLIENKINDIISLLSD